jgi:hypothetical protein
VEFGEVMARARAHGSGSHRRRGDSTAAAGGERRVMAGSGCLAGLTRGSVLDRARWRWPAALPLAGPRDAEEKAGRLGQFRG